MARSLKRHRLACIYTACAFAALHAIDHTAVPGGVPGFGLVFVDDGTITGYGKGHGGAAERAVRRRRRWSCDCCACLVVGGGGGWWWWWWLVVGGILSELAGKVPN